MAGPENPIVKLVRAVPTTPDCTKNFVFELAGNRTEYGLKSMLTAMWIAMNLILFRANNKGTWSVFVSAQSGQCLCYSL